MVPGKFAASFTVLGGTLEDPWWCSDVEFLFEAKGEKSTTSREYFVHRSTMSERPTRGLTQSTHEYRQNICVLSFSTRLIYYSRKSKTSAYCKLLRRTT